MTNTHQSDLGTTAARAVVWNYASFASGKVLVLITMAILARLLTPADFGMVGFATLVIAHLSVLQNLGLGPAVIQRKGDIEDAAQTVFVINLVLGAVFTILTILAAPFVAAFFDEPLVTPLLRVLAFSFIIVATVIVLEGVLSFLGLGVPHPTPSWGSMISDGRELLGEAPHVSFIPASVMFLTVLSFNMLGDSLRKALDTRESRV